jgi:hypothetical protein
MLRVVGRKRQVRYPSLESAMSRLNRPLFMIHGAKDTYIPVELTEKIFGLARQPKELWIVADARHNQAINLATEAYHARLSQFFQKTLGNGELAVAEEEAEFPFVQQQLVRSAKQASTGRKSPDSSKDSLPVGDAMIQDFFWWLIRKTLGRLAVRQARRVAAQFEADTHRPREVQEALLLRFLELNRRTRFSRENHLDTVHSVEQFRRTMRILKYEDLDPYIADMRKGQLDALVGEKQVHMFAMTSGTTSSRKYIPVTPQYLADYRRSWLIWGINTHNYHNNVFMRSILQLVSDWDEFRTESNIPCGSVSGLTAQMQKRFVRWMYCMPPITGRIKDITAKYYTALRLSMARDVSLITSANPSTLVNLARLMDHEKQELIRDIHNGTLSERFDLPRDVRDIVAHRVSKPNPKRARELEEIVKQMEHLYPSNVWPGLRVLGNWTGGNVGAYLRHYPKYYGNIPVRDLGLLASEGRMTIPLQDGTPSGVLDVSSHYFEFVPEHEINSDRPKIFAAHEVEPDRNYFILMTTAYGLYRYNIFDLVRVTGFHNKTPMLEFLNKGSSFASITGEKISEFQVVQAVQSALSERNQIVTSYTLAPCWNEETPYYGLFVERGDFATLDAARELALAVDRNLRKLNIEYDAKRESHRLAQIRALVMPNGELQKWDRQRLRKTGGTSEQFKHPCLYPDHTFREQVYVEAELATEMQRAG